MQLQSCTAQISQPNSTVQLYSVSAYSLVFLVRRKQAFQAYHCACVLAC
jgi:hypothetical protein